jgi:hypothetical protein
MLRLAQEAKWDKASYDNLFEEAVAKFPTYFPIYFSKTFSFFDESEADIPGLLAFAEQAAADTKKTEGSSLYARIIWWVHQSQSGINPRDFGVEWTRLDAAFKDLVAHYPDPYNVNAHANFACLYDKPDRAREILATISDEQIPEAWTRRGYESCYPAGLMRF